MSTAGLPLYWSICQRSIHETDHGRTIVLNSSLPAAVDSVTPYWPWWLIEKSEWLVILVGTRHLYRPRGLSAYADNVYLQSFLQQKPSVRWLSLTHKQFNRISHCCLQHTLTSVGGIWKFFSIASYLSSTILCILWGPCPWNRVLNFLSHEQYFTIFGCIATIPAPHHISS